MVEYLSLIGVIRVHYLTERPLYIEVKVGEMIQPPKFRHFYPASRVMSCMLCPSASSITSFGVR
jgi:hypothetical protein